MISGCSEFSRSTPRVGDLVAVEAASIQADDLVVEGDLPEGTDRVVDLAGDLLERLLRLAVQRDILQRDFGSVRLRLGRGGRSQQEKRGPKCEPSGPTPHALRQRASPAGRRARIHSRARSSLASVSAYPH